jgi:iron complex transport system substrate-binding protein
MDDLGRTIELKGEIRRVVSLAPNVTELIFAAGAGDRLVGVTSFCNFPEEAKSIAKIGDTMNPNMESIVALKPDIVFVSTASQVEAFTKTLEQNGILFYVTNPTSLDGVLYNIRQIADILGTTGKAEPVIASLRERIGKVWAKTGPAEKVRVFVQISREPLFTIGRDSFLNEPLVKAGAVSVTADVETAFPRLSKEAALALRPEVIILSDSEDNREPNEVFRDSPAVKNSRVYRINADLLSRPGPRLVDALEQLAAMLHPDLFKREE